MPSVRLRVRVLAKPARFTVDDMIKGAIDCYVAHGIQLLATVGPTIASDALSDLNCGDCTRDGGITAEQEELFGLRDEEGAIHAYFVRSTIPPYNGCSIHGPNRPSLVVSSIASRWTLAHELGHVLGLRHVDVVEGLDEVEQTDPTRNLIAMLIEDEDAGVKRFATKAAMDRGLLADV